MFKSGQRCRRCSIPASLRRGLELFEAPCSGGPPTLTKIVPCPENHLQRLKDNSCCKIINNFCLAFYATAHEHSPQPALVQQLPCHAKASPIRVRVMRPCCPRGRSNHHSSRGRGSATFLFKILALCAVQKARSSCRSPQSPTVKRLVTTQWNLFFCCIFSNCCETCFHFWESLFVALAF